MMVLGQDGRGLTGVNIPSPLGQNTAREAASVFQSGVKICARTTKGGKQTERDSRKKRDGER
jgi:hypothetical protein